MPITVLKDDAPDATPAKMSHQSVESVAQRQDAEREISAEVKSGESLHVFRLVPTAAPDDPNWDLAPSQGEITVVARSAADARVVAAAYELKFMTAPFVPGNDVSTMEASAFRNDRLYAVVETSVDCHGLPRGLFDSGPVVESDR